MSVLESLVSGGVGACVLTAVHETAHRVVPAAPRVDVLGMEAIEAGFRATGNPPPDPSTLYGLSLAGDLVSNSLYYSLVGLAGRDNAWWAGVALGLAAGIGAVALPGPLGLSTAPTNRTTATQLMTVAWYVAGGLAAAGVYQALTAGDSGA